MIKFYRLEIFQFSKGAKAARQRVLRLTHGSPPMMMMTEREGEEGGGNCCSAAFHVEYIVEGGTVRNDAPY